MLASLHAPPAAALLLLQLGGTSVPDRASPAASGAIDLSGEELPSLAPGASGALASWLERLSLWGYGAAAYVDTGGAGARPDGAFLVPDASLFLEATVTERSSFFAELLLERHNSIEYDEGVEVGEIYLRWRDLLGETGSDRLGLKLGRFDLPFGEDYLLFDSVDNALVTNSAAFPYGIDEGVLAHGSLGGLGWIASVTNGSTSRSASAGPSKAFTLKLHGEPLEGLHLSASGHTTGQARRSAMLVSGYYLSAVGCYGPSSVGASPNVYVKSHMWSANAVLERERWSLRAGVGQALVDDRASSFDRELTYAVLEPMVRLSPEVYLAARYSEIGTYRSHEGYRIDGAFTGGGEELGYDTRRLSRVSLALGWILSSAATIKLEVGQDRFDLIDGSPFDDENDERTYIAAEIVLAF